jgi:hypothetical protein
MSKPTYIILGPPRAGMNLLAGCLRLMGLTSLDYKARIDASSINNLLLQDLGLSPYSPAMPKGWLQADATDRARKRIRQLLHARIKTFESSSQFDSSVQSTSSNATQRADNNAALTYICVNNSLLAELWQEAFEESKLTPEYIFLQRHPFETAMSLAKNDNMDLDKGHILWLAHTKSALSAMQNRDYTLITYDQLLADPVSTISNAFGSLLTSDFRSLTSDLLDHVQPSLKHHHASNLPEDDRENFKSYELLYQQINLGHYSSLWKQDKSAEISEDMQLKSSSSSVFSAPDLIDSLLQAMVQQEHAQDSSRLTARPVKQPRGLPVEDWGSTGDNQFQLTASVTLPSSNEQGHITQSFPLLEDQWQKISLSIPKPDLLRDRQIFLIPLNTNGLVKISAINIFNKTNDNILKKISSKKDFNKLSIQGTAIRLPDSESLSLLITGTNPQIDLPAFNELPDIPLSLEIWIKAKVDQSAKQDNVLFSFVTNPKVSIPEFQALNLPKHLRFPDDEEKIIDYVRNNENGITTDDRFDIYCALAAQKHKLKDNLKALHYLGQAEKIAGDDPQYLINLARYYLNFNQWESALNPLIVSFFKTWNYDEHVAENLLKKYRQIYNKAKATQEHGQQVLMDYIARNINYLKDQTDHKLTLIEIGTTREDVPGMGSTVKLAKFCKHHDMHFITVDMDPQNTKLAQQDLAKIDYSFQAISQKGEDFLKDYTGPMDFVFLDAYDFDHGKHSEERQSRYEKYLGERISDKACHQMHLECAEQVVKKLSTFGAVCFDDTWYEDSAWQAKGTLGVPYLLSKNFCISMTGNKAALLIPDKSSIPKELVNTLKINLEYNKQREIDALIFLIDSVVTGRVCVTKYLHGLYLIKKFLGRDCKVYVETGSLFWWITCSCNAG